MNITEEIYATIEELVSSDKDIHEIHKIISDKFLYDKNYLDKLFLRDYKMSYRLYVKNAVLIKAYELWKSKNCYELTMRSTVGKIKYFRRKFISAFMITPEDAARNNIDMKIYLPNNIITDIFESSSIVENFKIKKDKYEIKIEMREVLICLLEMKTYIIPKMNIEYDSSSDESNDQLKMLLIILNCAVDEVMNGTFTGKLFIKDEDFEKEFILLDSYNLNSPIETSNLYIYSSIIPEYLFEIFCDEIDQLYLKFNLIYIYPSEIETNPELKTLYNEFYKIKYDIEKRRIRGSKEKRNEKIKILWKMVKMGLLRISDSQDNYI